MKTLTVTALSLTAPLAQAAPVPPPAVAEVQLRAANHAHVQACAASDHAALSGSVDQDFRLTGVDGDWLDKAAFVALGKELPQAEAISYDDVRVRLFGEVGVVHGMLAYLAPDYLVVFGDGSFHDKGSLLAAAAHPVTNMKSFPVTSVAIRRFGDVALVHAENPYERTDGKKGVNRYTDIWHKRDGRWACIAAHVTRHKLPS